MVPQPTRPRPSDAQGDGSASQGLHEIKRQMAALVLEAERLRAAAGHHRRILKELDQELRTPLTPILVELAVLEAGSDGPLPKRQAKAVALVRRNVQRWVAVAQRALAELQSDAGAESGRRVDLRVLLANVLTDLSGQALRDGLRLRSALPDEALVVLAPPDALRRALELLVQQAFTATPAGGGVTISAYRDEERIRVEVQDGGAGLSAAELGRLGDPAGWSAEGRDAWTLPLLRASLLLESMGARLVLETDGPGLGLSRTVEFVPPDGLLPNVLGRGQSAPGADQEHHVWSPI